jgi:EAL domain-containing protein (putative c-di-GMP-specific phosphodiesterase class I)
MNADTAMYKVKRGGKNSCIYYHEDMKNEIKSKREIESILRHALKHNEFTIYYQPQVDVQTGLIVSFEALLRLKRYSIGPGVFIPIAEETGHIIEIGRWVAREVIKQLADWQRKGFPPKPVAINYSGKQLRDKEYINYVRQLLNDYNMKEEYIEIEITEGILLENDVQTIEFLGELKKYGFKIALDDFGTGYSSLNYLTYLPVNKIKLDKSINDKFLELDNNKVMESLISLAHSLNLTITAEGIEDWDKFLKLMQSNCDYIQGYLFSKPLIASEVEGVYNKNFIPNNE